MEPRTCKGCDRPIFYDWLHYGGSENDEHYYHVGCYFFEVRNHEALAQPRDTKLHPEGGEKG